MVEILGRVANKSSSTSLTHDEIKLLARKILFYMGIQNVEEEVTINHNDKQYRIDLIGYPNKSARLPYDFKIAVECGNNKAEKIEVLRSIFPLVLILPYDEFGNLADVKDESKDVNNIGKVKCSYCSQYFKKQGIKMHKIFCKDNPNNIRLEIESNKTVEIDLEDILKWKDENKKE